MQLETEICAYAQITRRCRLAFSVHVQIISLFSATCQKSIFPSLLTALVKSSSPSLFHSMHHRPTMVANEAGLLKLTQHTGHPCWVRQTISAKACLRCNIRGHVFLTRSPRQFGCVTRHIQRNWPTFLERGSNNPNKLFLLDGYVHKWIYPWMLMLIPIALKPSLEFVAHHSCHLLTLKLP